jgi:hypothetical protein
MEEAIGKGLLNALLLAIPANERVEDGEDMAAVFKHARKNVAQTGLTLGVAVPLGENGGRHFDVTTELFRGMATEEEAVEKSGFPLGKIEVQRDFRGNELLWHRSHGEKAVYRKAPRRQVVPGLGCYVADNPGPKTRY